MNRTIPAGRYVARIDAATNKPNKKGDGKTLHIGMSVVGGAHNGQTLRDFVVVEHPDEQVLIRGDRKLAWIAKVVGLDCLTDTDELLGRMVTVAVENRDDSNGRAWPNVVRYSQAPSVAGGGCPNG